MEATAERNRRVQAVRSILDKYGVASTRTISKLLGLPQDEVMSLLIEAGGRRSKVHPDVVYSPSFIKETLRSLTGGPGISCFKLDSVAGLINVPAEDLKSWADESGMFEVIGEYYCERRRFEEAASKLLEEARRRFIPAREAYEILKSAGLTPPIASGAVRKLVADGRLLEFRTEAGLVVCSRELMEEAVPAYVRERILSGLVW